MSVANNKKIFQQKKNILQKFTYNIKKGGVENMKLTKKQKKQKLDKMFFEFLGCLAVSAVFILFMIYALEH